VRRRWKSSGPPANAVQAIKAHVSLGQDLLRVQNAALRVALVIPSDSSAYEWFDQIRAELVRDRCAPHGKQN
jgi:hypothetical protein